MALLSLSLSFSLQFFSSFSPVLSLTLSKNFLSFSLLYPITASTFRTPKKFSLSLAFPISNTNRLFLHLLSGLNLRQQKCQSAVTPFLYRYVWCQLTKRGEKCKFKWILSIENFQPGSVKNSDLSFFLSLSLTLSLSLPLAHPLSGMGVGVPPLFPTLYSWMLFGYYSWIVFQPDFCSHPSLTLFHM